MNTLDDLRATLDRHADDVTSDTTTARVASVRARAVRARRQRTGAVAGAAAAVVAVVAATTLLPGGAEPSYADRQLLGRTAPAELSALGYTYAFESGVDSRDGASSVELEASDEPRLITWAASDPVKVVEPGDVQVSERVDFDDWVYVPPRAEGTWTVHADETAIAVYELTDDRPPGVTVDGITYREQVGDSVLLGADIGDVGQDEVSVTYTVPAGDTAWQPMCQGAPAGAWLHVDLGDRLGRLSSGPGCDDPSFDPGGWGGSSGAHGRTGETLTATVYLTDGARGARIDSDDVRLGLGVYAEGRTERVAGNDVPDVFEDGGHLWRFDGSITEPRSTVSTAYTNNADESEMLWVTSSGSLRTSFRADFGGSDGVVNLQGGAGTWDTVLPGDQLRITARAAAADRLRFGYAWYVRAD